MRTAPHQQFKTRDGLVPAGSFWIGEEIGEEAYRGQQMREGKLWERYAIYRDSVPDPVTFDEWLNR